MNCSTVIPLSLLELATLCQYFSVKHLFEIGFEWVMVSGSCLYYVSYLASFGSMSETCLINSSHWMCLMLIGEQFLSQLKIPLGICVTLSQQELSLLDNLDILPSPSPIARRGEAG